MEIDANGYLMVLVKDAINGETKIPISAKDARPGQTEIDDHLWNAQNAKDVDLSSHREL